MHVHVQHGVLQTDSYMKHSNVSYLINNYDYTLRIRHIHVENKPHVLLSASL